MAVDLSLPEPPARKERRVLPALTLLTVLAVLVLLLVGDGGTPAPRTRDAPLLGRELAETLEKRTLHREAAALWEELARTDPEPAVALYRAGRSRMLAGDAERALRNFLAAESLGLPEELAAETDRHVLECYAALGKFGVRNAELRRRTGDESEDATDAVARIGEEEVSREELEAAVRDEEAARLAAAGRLSRDALDEAVAAALADPARLAPTLRGILSRRALALEATARGLPGRPEVMRRMSALRREALASLLVQERLLEGVKITESDLRDHFAAHRERYVEPAAVRFSRATDAGGAPGPFVEVEGWHARGEPFPGGRGPSAEADAALFALGVGEISPRPVPLEDGIAFLRVDERRDARPLSFDEARDLVTRDLAARRQAEAVARLREEVAARHPAAILDEKLRDAMAGTGGARGE